jgi:hypothetical protein
MTRDELEIHASKSIHDALTAATRAGLTPDEIAQVILDFNSGATDQQNYDVLERVALIRRKGVDVESVLDGFKGVNHDQG